MKNVSDTATKEKTQKNLSSLYELRSIKTIVSDNNESFLDTPIRSTFQSFQPSFQQSRKITNNQDITPIKITSQDLFQVKPIPKVNQYTEHGYINNNISN